MSKPKSNDNGAPTDGPQAPPQPAQAGGNDATRKPGGRTIGRWKVQAHKKLPEGSDEQVAALINEFAAEEGFFEYECHAATVAKWRESDARQPAQIPAPDEEGHAYGVLRQLVFLLGKEGTKKLIESL